MLWIPLELPEALNLCTVSGKKIQGFLTALKLHNWLTKSAGRTEDFTQEFLESVSLKISDWSDQEDHLLLVVDLSEVNSLTDANGGFKKDPSFGSAWQKVGGYLERSVVSLAFTACTDLISSFIRSNEDHFPPALKFESRDRDLIIYGLLSDEARKFIPNDSVAFGSKELVQRSIDSYLRDSIEKSFYAFPNGWEPLRSTPIDATGYFNANFLIGDPQVFPWLVFMLSRKLLSFVAGDHQQSITLVALTRNGTVLAKALSRFMDLSEVNVIDHLGPVSQVVESYSPIFSTESTEKPRFVFVGDILIAGTEYRLCDTYATTVGARFEGAVFIAALKQSVDHLLKPPGNQIRSKRIEYLFNLLDLHRSLQFRFPVSPETLAQVVEMDGFTFEASSQINILTAVWDSSDTAKVFKDLDEVQNSAQKSSGKLMAVPTVPPKFLTIQEKLSFDRSASPSDWTFFQVLYLAAHGDPNTVFINYESDDGYSIESLIAMIGSYVDEQIELKSKHGLDALELKVLFVNCCHSSFFAERLKSKIDCVIGIEGAVSGQVAHLFCKGFFEGLRITRNTRTALRSGYNIAISSTKNSRPFRPKAWIKGEPVRFS